MFKRSITLQLTGGVVIIVLVSMLAIGLIFIQMFKQYTFESREETMLTRGRSIAELVNINATGGHMQGMGGMMHNLDILAEAKIWIIDQTGNPAAMSGMGQGMGKGRGHMNNMNNMNNSEPLPQEAEKVIVDVLSGGESVSESFSSVYQEATLTVGVPVQNSSGQITGAVLLHAPVAGVTPLLNQANRILVLSLLGALLLAIALGLGFSRYFARPLKTMNRTALAMAGGNYAVQTGIEREDEIGQLGQSLDLLAHRLDYTIDLLFQEKSKLNDIIASMAEGLVAFDRDLKPQSMNFALSRIMYNGLPYPDEILANHFRELGLEADLKEIMEQKKSSIIMKDWKGKKLKFILSPISNNLGMVTGCVALVQDVSESERLEQLRRDFVANVSHEFRTPLTVIRGSLEALVDGTIIEDQEKKRYLSRMLAETRGLERLVGDLLDLSRLQSGKITMNIEEIHLPTLLSDVLKSLQTLADKKEIQMRYEGEKDLAPIPGDYDRLRQMLVIFLDNAIKYSPPHTLVSVETKDQQDQTLTITIRDQGPGINPEQLPYIWDRFYKGEKSRQGGGTGLGLAIAKHLIDLHHGSVTVESVLDQGTMIEIKLPLSFKTLNTPVFLPSQKDK
ncbi:HAMP domain-containing sensor histidine kinase [Dehalobacterium formicoaceticum]|uniref:histidine kinase n=1 Tax=Dehalobacterium formicoaceticum TaxID=51515 RepID=A0ABT1Y2K5_9FIRM|nr:cell wall metabolism sensor histidine kinase WalK [Dehalobacterium formicoaceticum]MCR6545107.1 cell wall metabolism sensor histidine kinase WalK [Dehalobacterium formicoaceticum]